MKKVVAYCRVSTDKEDQKNSLENQRKFFKEYITRNSDWEFYDLYIEGADIIRPTQRSQ